MQFTVHTAKSQLSKLIDAALRGEDVVIAKGNKPAVRLVPVPTKCRLFGALEGKLTVPDDLFEPMTDDELRLWENN